MKVQAELSFMKQDPIWSEEKPYRLRYTPANGFPVTNFIIKRHSMEIQSMRDLEEQPTLDQQGFEVCHFQTQFNDEDFDDPETCKLYEKEIEQFIKVKRGAASVLSVDYEVRRRNTAFPLASDDTRHTQPSRLAHTDLTYEGARTLIRELYGAAAEDILQAPFELITAWRPLRGPLMDWPLAVCDTRSVDHGRDMIAADAVYSHVYAENAIAFHHQDQRWYYLPDQAVDELLIFRSAHSVSPESRGCPHASFDLRAHNALPRHSVDVRLLVMYAHVDYPELKW